MGTRPTFVKKVKLQDGQVRVEGVLADDDKPTDIVSIWIVLAQGKRIHGNRVDDVSSPWNTKLPLKDPAADTPDFHTGDAIAFGVQMYHENFTTISWAETVKIEQA
jgi:hypothetical protein